MVQLGRVAVPLGGVAPRPGRRIADGDWKSKWVNVSVNFSPFFFYKNRHAIIDSWIMLGLVKFSSVW